MFNRTVATVGLIALLWLLCTLTIPGPLQAEVYFDSDFETCNVGTHNDFPCEGWDDRVNLGGNPEWATGPLDNTVEITNVGSLSGVKSVKETFRSGIEGINKPSIYHAIPRTDHLFARAMARRDPNFQICPINLVSKQWRFRGEVPGEGGFPVISIWLQNYRYIVAVEGGYAMGTVNYQGGPVISTTWDQVELEIKLNTPGVADGLVRLWVNGTLYIERLNLQLRGPTPTSTVMLNGAPQLVSSLYNFSMMQLYTQCGVDSLYWDRFAAGNTRIGPVSVGGDSTPPARPTLNPIP